MRVRTKTFEEIFPIEFLEMRERVGFKRYRKRTKRDKEKREILIGLGLKKIEEKEKEDFIPVGFRRRKVNVSFL